MIVANDLIIKANFVAKPSGLHTLSIQSIPAQGGKHVGSGAYEIGDEIEISALELPGYVFEKWIGDGVIDPSQATTLVKILGDHSILAQFSPLDHNLEIISGEGGVALGGGSYSYGNTVNISAVPAVGYRFLYWDGMGIIEPFKKSTQIIITDDMTIQPKFALQEHTLTIDTSTGGVVLGEGKYDHGETVKIEALPATGYEFSGWFGLSDEVVTTPTHTLTLTEDLNISAEFKLLEITFLHAEKTSAFGLGTINIQTMKKFIISKLVIGMGIL